MPKHLSLDMALHYFTGSLQVIAVVNRFGHCSSYGEILELENTMQFIPLAVTQFCHIMCQLKAINSAIHACTIVISLKKLHLELVQHMSSMA